MGSREGERYARLLQSEMGKKEDEAKVRERRHSLSPLIRCNMGEEKKKGQIEWNKHKEQERDRSDWVKVYNRGGILKIKCVTAGCLRCSQSYSSNVRGLYFSSCEFAVYASNLAPSHAVS